jgi:hypothetical protein
MLWYYRARDTLLGPRLPLPVLHARPSLEDFRSEPHLLSPHRLQRMAFLSKFVRGKLAELVAPNVGEFSHRGSDEKARE